MTIATFTGTFEFLSNFSAHPVTLDGITYPTAEHAFQAQKTDDRDLRLKIARLDTPAKAKWFGKHRVKMSPKKLQRWKHEGAAVEAMQRVLHAKFENFGLACRLVETGDRDLIEGNTHRDTFWGVYRGVGKNMLGKLLMSQRAEIRKHMEG